MKSAIERVEKAINEFREGKIVILTDHPDRENEGDFIFPAEKITPEVINFMMRFGSGIICLSLTEEKLKKLDLPLMVPAHENTNHHGVTFAVSIEAKEGVSTGVSAIDRVKTILAAVNQHARPQDLVKPGHVFPLQAVNQGVLKRAGHTEGAMDLAWLSGFLPAGVLCEAMNPDGTMMRGKILDAFAKEHQLLVLSVSDLIEYRLGKENLIEEEASAILPLENYGSFKITVIKEKINRKEHLVLTKENKNSKLPLLVRIHSACMTGDLFFSERCDCNKQLHYSLKKISEEGGMLIYLNQEGRGIGLFNKIKAYALQEKGMDTVEANQYLGLPVDLREYSIAASFLRNQQVYQLRLLTNNPAKIADLKKYGISDVKMEMMPSFSNEHNKNYLKIKKNKLHHFIQEVINE